MISVVGMGEVFYFYSDFCEGVLIIQLR